VEFLSGGDIKPFQASRECGYTPLKPVLSDIHQIAAGSFANLPRFRVLGNPAPLAPAVDGDGTSRRRAERAEFSVIEAHRSRVTNERFMPLM
jgi:hypothetical protein